MSTRIIGLVQHPDGALLTGTIAVTPRDWTADVTSVVTNRPARAAVVNGVVDITVESVEAALWDIEVSSKFGGVCYTTAAVLPPDATVSLQDLVDQNAPTGAGGANFGALGSAAWHDVAASGDAGTSQVVLGSDTRLTDSRVPDPHAAGHAAGGADQVVLSQDQVTGLAGALADKASTPASSTDNAVPRFDGTTGKALQGSGVTIDDANNVSGVGTMAASGLAGGLLSSANPTMSGAAAPGTGTVPSRQDHVHPSDSAKASLAGATFTGDLVVSKALPLLSLAAATGSSARLYFGSDAGQTQEIRFRTGGIARWILAKTAAAESGSNAGSNLDLYRYDDAGAVLGTAFSVNRATGKVTVGAAGADAGLELGASGPRQMVGTGSPEGVVTASVGATWTDTDATTGAVFWRKVSGSGNTGWRVADGDTGIRNITSLLLISNGFTSVGTMRIRRINNVVMLVVGNLQRAANGSGDYLNIPAGFRPDTDWAYYIRTHTNNAAYFTSRATAIMAGVLADYHSAAWFTADPWPTTLPGS